jgi:hypothetical protein
MKLTNIIQDLNGITVGVLPLGSPSKFNLFDCNLEEIFIFFHCAFGIFAGCITSHCGPIGS